MVLSGMGNMQMVSDNCGYMADFKPLNEEEAAAVEKVCEIFRNLGAVSCTACRYCTEVCPQGLEIPTMFSCLNAKKIFQSRSAIYYYQQYAEEGKRAKDCLQCGACEGICPQHLPIRELLQTISQEFDNEDS